MDCFDIVNKLFLLVIIFFSLTKSCLDLIFIILGVETDWHFFFFAFLKVLIYI
jgi:hypothetical protein